MYLRHLLANISSSCVVCVNCVFSSFVPYAATAVDLLLL